MEQVCRALNVRCAMTFRHRRGASDLPHVGDVIRYHQRRNAQAEQAHEKQRLRCVI